MNKRIIVAASAISAGVLLLAPWNINFLVRRNKDFLIGRSEQALGRKISVDEIEIILLPLGARLVNFALANDPAFSSEDILRAKELRLEIRLLPLFIGQFRPKRISLESPTITVVRDASGRYNFNRRSDSDKKRDARTDNSKKRSAEEQDRLPSWFPPCNISGGTLRYRDLTRDQELVVSQIDLKTSDFEQDQPFEIELEAAINASRPNLHFKSRIGPIAENADFRDIPFDGEINATDLDLGKVNKTLPQLRRALPRALRFDGVYTIKELDFKGTLNNPSLKGAVTGTDASFRFE